MAPKESIVSSKDSTSILAGEHTADAYVEPIQVPPRHAVLSGSPGIYKSRWRRCLATAGAIIEDQWFLFGLGLVVLLSSRAQVPNSQQELKQTVTTYVCVAIIFLITGCTLPTKELVDNYQKWKVHIFVQVQSFLMTSAIVFAVHSQSVRYKSVIYGS